MSFAAGLKTIVVATGQDGKADGALEYARKLAVAYEARVVLAHGTDPLEYASVSGVPGKVLSGLTEQARAALDQMAANLIREGIHSHSEIRQGEVAQMLVDVAEQYEAGLIVIGTEGRQGVGPVLVGAIAEQLVRLAKCAVHVTCLRACLPCSEARCASSRHRASAAATRLPQWSSAAIRSRAPARSMLLRKSSRRKAQRTASART